MGDADGPPESSGGRSGNDLPVMPGPEKPLLHIAIEFVESLDNALAEQQMLNVAHGELPAEAACIIDVPIEAVALPDPGDRYYASALVKRLEIQTRNQSNRARRLVCNCIQLANPAVRNARSISQTEKSGVRAGDAGAVRYR